MFAFAGAFAYLVIVIGQKRYDVRELEYLGGWEYMHPLPNATCVSAFTTVALRITSGMFEMERQRLLLKETSGFFSVAVNNKADDEECDGSFSLVAQRSLLIFTPKEPFTPGSDVFVNINTRSERYVSSSQKEVSMPRWRWRFRISKMPLDKYFLKHSSLRHYNNQSMKGKNNKRRLSSLPFHSDSSDYILAPSTVEDTPKPHYRTLPRGVPRVTTYASASFSQRITSQKKNFHWFLAPFPGGNLLILDAKGDVVYFDKSDSLNTVKRGSIALDFKPLAASNTSDGTGDGLTISFMGTGIGLRVSDDFRNVKTSLARHRLKMDGHVFTVEHQNGYDCHNLKNGTSSYFYIANFESDKAEQIVVIQEVDDCTGLVIFEWRSIDYLTIGKNLLKTNKRDIYHANSLVKTSEGDFVLSLRNTHQILKIDGMSGNIKWRFGGENGDFSFEKEEHKFTNQHCAIQLSNGNIQLYDNGDAKRNFSRALEFTLDITQWHARLVAELIHPKKLYGPRQGSVQTVNYDSDANGVVVSWGCISAFCNNGKELLHVKLPAVTAFRTATSQDVEAEIWFMEPLHSYRVYLAPWENLGKHHKPRLVLCSNTNDRESPRYLLHYSFHGVTSINNWILYASSTIPFTRNNTVLLVKHRKSMFEHTQDFQKLVKRFKKNKRASSDSVDDTIFIIAMPIAITGQRLRSSYPLYVNSSNLTPLPCQCWYMDEGIRPHERRQMNNIIRAFRMKSYNRSKSTANFRDVRHIAMCQKECQNQNSCNYFTYNELSGICYLLSSRKNFISNVGVELVSGPKRC